MTDNTPAQAEIVKVDGRTCHVVRNFSSERKGPVFRIADRLPSLTDSDTHYLNHAGTWDHRDEIDEGNDWPSPEEAREFISARQAASTVQGEAASESSVKVIYPPWDQEVIAILDQKRYDAAADAHFELAAHMRDLAAEFRKALASQPPAQAWQPIASAPKDGTRFIVYWPYWSNQPFVGYYCGASGAWEGDRCVSSVHSDTFQERQPTHWAPLPPPPTPQSEEVGNG